LVAKRYWPQIGIEGGIIYSNLNFIHSSLPFSANNQLSWNALVTVEYNFWDWGQRRRDVQIAHLNQNAKRNDLMVGLLDTRARIEGLMIDIARIRENYQLSQELLQNEESNYKNIEIQYREGKLPYLDLITSLNTLLDARTLFFTNYFQGLQNLTRYRFFEGSLYETIFKD
jgi:outer membrane protein TolC